jgi:hypothetical protein
MTCAALQHPLVVLLLRPGRRHVGRRRFAAVWLLTPVPVVPSLPGKVTGAWVSAWFPRRQRVGSRGVSHLTRPCVLAVAFALNFRQVLPPAHRRHGAVDGRHRHCSIRVVSAVAVVPHWRR